MPGELWAVLRRSRALHGLLGIALFVACWAVLSATYTGGGGGTIPSPLSVLRETYDLLRQPRFWHEFGVTVDRGARGLGLALVAGVVLSLGLARSRVVNSALEPWISLLYPVPRIALFPLAVIALGIGAPTQITLVAVECVFPLTVSIYAGLRGIDGNLMRLAANVDAGAARTWSLMVRAALPSVFTGLRIAVPIVLTLTVATQMFTASSDGLGYLIQQRSAQYDTEGIFAIALLIGLFGYLADQVLVRTARLTSRHERVGQGS